VRAAARTRWRVTSRIGTPLSRLLRIRDTVVTDTPDMSATSRKVTDARVPLEGTRCAPPAQRS
jgi:hypothetical protein